MRKSKDLRILFLHFLPVNRQYLINIAYSQGVSVQRSFDGSNKGLGNPFNDRIIFLTGVGKIVFTPEFSIF